MIEQKELNSSDQNFDDCQLGLFRIPVIDENSLITIKR